MRKITLPLLILGLMSCGRPEGAAVRTQAGVTSTDSLRAQLHARFGSLPDTVEFRDGSRVRLVYLDTSGRDLSSRSVEVAYAEDSLQFDRAFEQAMWLWTSVAKREGADTISVRHIALEAHQGAPLVSAEYYFYPKQLDNPAERPALSRESVGPNRSDTLPLRRP